MIAALVAEIPEWSGWVIWPLVLCVSSLTDALYSGMETGIYQVNKIRLDLHAEGGHPPAIALRTLLRHPRNLLAVLLIGTNIARYVSTFAITSMMVLAGAGEQAEDFTIAVATPIMFVLGDAVPKNVFNRLDEKPVYAMTLLVRVSDKLFKLTGLSPLVLAISWVVLKLVGNRRGEDAQHWNDRLANALSEGHASGAITHFQSVMADRVMHIGDVKLHDVMVPMDQTVAAKVEVHLDELVELYRRHDVSRIPLLADGKVVGILDVYDALTQNHGRATREKMTEPTILPGDLSVDNALYRMQSSHAVMAIVEEAGQHVGIVTIKDLIEEIIGEIEAW